MAEIQINPSVSPVVLPSLLPPGGEAALTPAQQKVATEIAKFRAGQPSKIDGNDWAMFEAMYRGSAGMDPRFSLSDLPADVAQAILDNQAKTMEQFFETWAKSIEENAKADKEASNRAQLLKEQLDKPIDVRRQKGLFAAALNFVVNASIGNPTRPADLRISPQTAQRIADEHGLSASMPSPPITPNGWKPVPQHQLVSGLALPTGNKSGVLT